MIMANIIKDDARIAEADRQTTRRLMVLDVGSFVS